MKTLLPITLFSALAITLLSTPPLPQGDKIGRFQLIAGSRHNAISNKILPELYRIDTATGETWRLDGLGGLQSWELLMDK